MNGLEKFRADHQVVLPILERMKLALHALRGNAPWLEQRGPLDEFLAAWDKEIAVHFQQEEDALFPFLADALGGGGPIPVMLAEHVQLREAVDALQALARQENPDLTTLTKHMATVVFVLTDHIYKEDNVLLVMAEEVLRPAEKAEVDRRMGLA